ncbi:MAG TPA: Uma2 family endonuclease [Steroidobacteraceae bacterium]
MSVVRRDSHRHTYADYLVWSRSHGDELVDGTAYVKEPPSPSWSHQRIVIGLGSQIAAALKDEVSQVVTAPLDVRLQTDTVVQPDVLIVCDPRKVDERGVRGAPDWIAEVLSPGTARHDQFVKLPAYERAGVREVWLINPADRTVAIYRLEAGRYGRPIIRELKGQTQLTAVPTVTIDWDQVLARI